MLVCWFNNNSYRFHCKLDQFDLPWSSNMEKLAADICWLCHLSANGISPHKCNREMMRNDEPVDFGAPYWQTLQHLCHPIGHNPPVVVTVRNNLRWWLGTFGSIISIMLRPQSLWNLTIWYNPTWRHLPLRSSQRSKRLAGPPWRI